MHKKETLDEYSVDTYVKQYQDVLYEWIPSHAGYIA